MDEDELDEFYEWCEIGKLKAMTPKMSDGEIEKYMEVKRAWRKLAKDFDSRNKKGK